VNGIDLTRAGHEEGALALKSPDRTVVDMIVQYKPEGACFEFSSRATNSPGVIFFHVVADRRSVIEIPSTRNRIVCRACRMFSCWASLCGPLVMETVGNRLEISSWFLHF